MFIVPSYNAAKKVTALLVGRLGDLIVATPFLRSLRRRYPRAKIRLVTSAAGEAAARMVPSIDEVLVAHRFTRPVANLKLAAKLLGRRCDVLVDLNPSFSRLSAAMAAAMRSPLKAAFEKGRMDRLYDVRAAKPAEDEPMLDRYRRLAHELDAPYDPALELHVPESAHRTASKLLRDLSPDFYDDRANVAIHPGNFKKFDNRWPEDKFVLLTKQLLEDDRLRLFYLAGPGELAPVKAIVEQLPRPVPILPPASVPVAAALLSRMRLCVLNVTGTTHLAAAVGTPTFAFYSGYTAAVWRPRGSNHAGVVSKSWESCRDIPVKAAQAALADHLDALVGRDYNKLAR
jgi:ADP-heptose:LPS heptosyltransferase